MKKIFNHRLIFSIILILCLPTIVLSIRAMDPITADAISIREESDNVIEIKSDKTLSKKVSETDLLKEEETKSESKFSFRQITVSGRTNETLYLNFDSTTETNEITLKLPKKAKLVKEKLPADLTLATKESNVWVISSNRLIKTFTLPLMFEEQGVFEVSLEENKIIFEIECFEKKTLAEEITADVDEPANEQEDGEITKTIVEKDNRNISNLLENPNFVFSSGEDNLISSWELASSTYPVNVLNRALTIALNPNSDGLYQLSDNSFFLDNNDFLQINRPNGSRTLLINQVIPTIKGQTYKVEITARTSNASSGTLYMTAYGLSGLIAGPVFQDLFEHMDLTSDFTTYSRTFKATGPNTTIGFRAQGSSIELYDANVIPVPYELTLEAIPSEGGDPIAEKSSLLTGESTKISPNPHEDYQFSHWRISNDDDLDVISSSSPTTEFTMGSEDTTIEAIYVPKVPGEVHVYYLSSSGYEIADKEVIKGVVGEPYVTKEKNIKHYNLIENPWNAEGILKEETVIVQYKYELEKMLPLDPLFPNNVIDPENKPDLSKNQGLFSIDFVSQFDFGLQKISLHEAVYYANPQRFLNGDGMINEEERPNFVQISDRRFEEEQSVWQLAVTQKYQFSTINGQELAGAQIHLENIESIWLQEDGEFEIQKIDSIALLPSKKSPIFTSLENEGAGTWIFRFGDETTAHESVKLNIPRGANPRAESYTTSLVWELSAIPGN
ncbi:WxL domain-containing protein [Enterococcus innesii]|uniref:WxL domain-containing protein n=1 Tax=Enterococcus innesii TaxID=2839759 RepID=UPI002DB9F086|nr:WxL domain-containing protein [Enterococcus innesii]MEB5953194.1 WxL domain-containing protein [Enterococcus innesii]